MPFTPKEKSFCALEYARAQSPYTVLAQSARVAKYTDCISAEG